MELGRVADAMLVLDLMHETYHHLAARRRCNVKHDKTSLSRLTLGLAMGSALAVFLLSSRSRTTSGGALGGILKRASKHPLRLTTDLFVLEEMWIATNDGSTFKEFLYDRHTR